MKQTTGKRAAERRNQPRVADGDTKWGTALTGIEPNKILTPPLGINFPQDNKPADLKIELTGVRFK